MLCKLAKIVSTYSFQAPSSKDHAPFKLAQAELFLMGAKLNLKNMKRVLYNLQKIQKKGENA